MKKLLMILGGIFLVLAAVVAVGVTIIVVKGSALDRESKQYVDATVPVIADGWDIAQIQQRASPEFNAAITNADLQKLLRMFRKLGKIKAYNGAKGDANMSITSQQGKVISATYIASADFENGPAEIKMSLIKHGDQWQILGIHVDSKVFLE